MAAAAGVPLLAACSASTPAAPLTAPVASLAGIQGTWASQQVTFSGTPYVDGTVITLTAEPAGIRVSAGCNTMSASAQISDGVLRSRQVQSTELGCTANLVAQDRWLAGLLSGAPRVERTGPVMSLIWDGGSIEFADRAWLATQTAEVGGTPPAPTVSTPANGGSDAGPAGTLAP